MTKLTVIDKRILELLKKHEEGRTIWQICAKLELYQNSVQRRLQYLHKHLLVTRIRTFRASFYKWNPRTRQDYIFNVVQCPKCGATKEVHDYQTNATCPDPSCVSESGKRTRFFIYDKNIIRRKQIIHRERE